MIATLYINYEILHRENVCKFTEKLLMFSITVNYMFIHVIDIESI